MPRSRASRYFRSATALGVLAVGLSLPAVASADPIDLPPLVAPQFQYGPQVDAGHGPVVSVLHGHFGAAVGEQVVAVADAGPDRDGNAAQAGVALIGRGSEGFDRLGDVTLQGDMPVAAVAGKIEDDGATSAVVVSRGAALPRGSTGNGKLESVDWRAGERHRAITLPGQPVAVAVGEFLPGRGPVVAVSMDGNRLAFYAPLEAGFELVYQTIVPTGPLSVVPRQNGTGDALMAADGDEGERYELDAVSGSWSPRSSGHISGPFGASAGAVATERDPWGNRWYAAQVGDTWSLSWFDTGLGQITGYLASSAQLGAPMVMNLYGGPERDVVAALDGDTFRALHIETERTTQTGITSSRIATALDVDDDRRDDLIVARDTGVTLYHNDTGTYANQPELSANALVPSVYDSALGRQVVTEKTFKFVVPTDTADRYECQIGNGPWVDCVGPNGERTLSVPSNGSYKLHIRRMAAGTKFWSAEQSIGFVVSEAPSPAPAKPVLQSQPSALSNSAAFWLAAPVAGTRTEYRVDGTGDWKTATSPLFLDLEDGPHRVSFRAVDIVTGTPSDAVDADFDLDATRPAAPAKVAGPTGPSTARKATFAFEGEPDATFECRVDQRELDRGVAGRTPSTWRPCLSPFTVDDLALGDHVVEVRQTDPAGNHSAVATWEWTIVVPTPDVTVKPVPAPVKEAPAAEAPAATPTPAAPAPAPAPTPVPAAPKAIDAELAVGAPAAKGKTPVATATGRRVAVGCAAPGATDYRCTVSVTRGGKTVGQGRRTGSGVVPVNLDKATARKVQRLGGLKVRVTLTVKTEDGRTSKTQKTVRILPRKVLVVPTDGLFAFDSATPSRKADALAKQIAGQLDGARTITIVGHTDAKGAADVNRRLGQQRAEAFRRLLAKHGFDGKVAVESAGDTQPRTSNDTESGRALNRRVEIDVRY